MPLPTGHRHFEYWKGSAYPFRPEYLCRVLRHRLLKLVAKVRGQFVLNF
jgi:hypothetical protein